MSVRCASGDALAFDDSYDKDHMLAATGISFKVEEKNFVYCTKIFVFFCKKYSVYRMKDIWYFDKVFVSCEKDFLPPEEQNPTHVKKTISS